MFYRFALQNEMSTAHKELATDAVLMCYNIYNINIIFGL